MFQERKKIYEAIEKSRHSKVIAYATSNRRGMDMSISPEAVEVIGEHLDKVGNTKMISLILKLTLLTAKLLPLLYVFFKFLTFNTTLLIKSPLTPIFIIYIILQN